MDQDLRKRVKEVAVSLVRLWLVMAAQPVEKQVEPGDYVLSQQNQLRFIN